MLQHFHTDDDVVVDGVSRAVEGVGEKKANARRTAEAVGTISELVGGNVSTDSVWKEIEYEGEKCAVAAAVVEEPASRKRRDELARQAETAAVAPAHEATWAEQLLVRVVSRRDCGHVEDCRQRGVASREYYVSIDFTMIRRNSA